MAVILEKKKRKIYREYHWQKKWDHTAAAEKKRIQQGGEKT